MGGPELELGVAGGHRHPRQEIAQVGVVVEHLLEVRDEPTRVGRVAGEATAQVVVDAARGHGVERGGDHVQRGLVTGVGVMAKQRLRGHRRRELRRGAESAVSCVVRPRELLARLRDVVEILAATTEQVPDLPAVEAAEPRSPEPLLCPTGRPP